MRYKLKKYCGLEASKDRDEMACARISLDELFDLNSSIDLTKFPSSSRDAIRNEFNSLSMSMTDPELKNDVINSKAT